MARIWKEKLDVERHRNYKGAHRRGGYRVAKPKDNLIVKWVYFVNVCSFTFQFHSVNDIYEYLDYFSQKPISNSGKSGGRALEPEWRAWHERIPIRLKKEAKRKQVVKALQQALDEFS